MTEKKTVVEELRGREKDIPPWMYACYHLGHFVDEKGLCYCCLKVFPPEVDGDE